ncbi:MAG: thioredoxin family protein [Bacillota bacterium]
MEIKVYGTGCQKCTKLYDIVTEVVEELDVDVKVNKVQDMADITSAGIMSLPGLGINGEVKIKGRVPSSSEIKELIEAEL